MKIVVLALPKTVMYFWRDLFLDTVKAVSNRFCNWKILVTAHLYCTITGNNNVSYVTITGYGKAQHISITSNGNVIDVIVIRNVTATVAFIILSIELA